MRLMASVLGLVFVLTAMPVQAQTDLPIYPSEANCRSHQVPFYQNACIKSEQSDYDFLKATWGLVAEPIRRFCVGAAEKNRPAQYHDLQTCIAIREMQMRAAEPAKPFRY